MTLDDGKYGIFLVMGNAGFSSSTVRQVPAGSNRWVQKL